MKTLLFDLGNVLLNFSHEKMCAQIASEFQVPVAKIKSILFEKEGMLRLDRGEISEQALHETLQNELKSSCELSRLQRAAGDIFVPNPGMPELVRELKQRGLRLVLLSNTCFTHINWIRQQFDILDCFDELVLSYEVGVTKPQPEIFEVALQKIECSPQECLYTDDILEYIAAAQIFGLNAVQFTTLERFRVTLQKYDIL